MKTATLEDMNTDKIIKQIDNELLILDEVSRTKSEYQIFDFYEALKNLNEAILADTTNRKEYFKLKIEQYRSVFYDLFFTPGAVIYFEYLSYDPDKRLLKFKETICLYPAYLPEEHSCEKTIEDESRHRDYLPIYRGDVSMKKPTVTKLNKYDYLLGGCLPSTATTKESVLKTMSIEFLISDFDKLLPPVLTENILSELTFKGYIEKLKFMIGVDKSNKNPENPYPEIFTNEGYKLFKYLDENYTGDNNSPKAKYSWIFHFLKYHQMVSCTNDQYRLFISNLFGIKFSRVQDPQHKYDNTIQPLLERLRVNFNQNIVI